MKNVKNQFFTRPALVTICAIAVTVFCFAHLVIHALSLHQKNLPFPEPGFFFKNFSQYLTGVERIGYVTNKETSAQKNDGFFLQAQFALAPVIVELGDLDHDFFIIDSVDKNYIIGIVRANPSFRVTNNLYGQALYQRR